MTSLRTRRGKNKAESKAQSESFDEWAGARSFHTRDPFALDGGADFVVRSLAGSGNSRGSMKSWTMALGGDARMTRPFAQNPWVYACVVKIAQSIGALPFKLQRPSRKPGAEGRWEDVTSGPMFDLFRRPNPQMSPRKFLELIVMHYLLDGESYLVLLDENSQPVESGAFGEPITKAPKWIVPVRGELVQEKCESTLNSLPTEYHVYSSGQRERVPAASVAAITTANPYSHTRGIGPTSALMREIGKMFQADRYDEGILRNGGRPGGYLTTDQDISEEEAEAVTNSFTQKHGTPDRAGGVALLPYGTTFKESGFRPKDMEFSQMREWSRQAVMSVYGVTKTVLAITDDVNRANAVEAYRVFWEVTNLPIIGFLQDEIQFNLLDRMTGEDAGMRLVLDTSGVSVLREDLDAKVKRALQLFTEGKITLRDAARISKWTALAEAEFEGLDERWVKNTEQPYDLAVNPATATITMATPAEEVIVRTDATDAEDAEDEAIQKERILVTAWKAHDDFLAKREKRMAKKVKRVFEEYVLAVRKKLRARAKKSAGATVVRYVATEAEIERVLAMNKAEWEQALGDAVIADIEETLLAAAVKLHAEVSGEGVILTLTDPAVVEFMAAKEVSLVEGSMSSLAQDVQRKIVKVLAGAEDATSVAAAILEVFEDLEAEMKVMVNQMGARAEMIARTEVNSAVSFARTEQMKEDDVTEHSWLSSRDGAVRDHHADLDGKKVKVGKVFGYGLKYPGDGSGSADPGDFINCRCTTLPE